MTINQWPKQERPRERLLKYGASKLSNAELLAIFLRTGIVGKTALDLARDLLNKFGSLDKILESDFNAFTSINGLGIAKYCQLKATLELTKRHFGCKVQEVSAFTDQETAKNYLLNHFTSLENERFACLFLDNKNQLIKFVFLFNGTINQAQVYPRVVAQSCLKHNAAAVIFAHNHPSGCIKASDSDIHITRKLTTALELIDVRVLDHFIVGHNEVYSMAQNGLM
ncbi:MAG: DNA repair protein RadC [Marinicellaceae bacterium]